jgi:hypothetical protein
MAGKRQKLAYDFVSLGPNDRDMLDKWYKVYARCFPDADEREEFEAFSNLLRLNDDSRIQKNLGPWIEAVLAIRDLKTREIVGGLNFGVSYGTDPQETDVSAISIQVPFLFIDPAFRQAHRQEALVITPLPVLAAIRHWVDERLGKIDPALPRREILVFFEANDPTRMSAEQRREDKSNAQIDPYVRYRYWLEFAKALDFKYVQPPLQPGKNPVTYLDLFCMVLHRQPGDGNSRPTSAGVPATMLLNHLKRFFSISVLKGQTADDDTSFVAMRKELRPLIEANGLVPFVPDTAAKVMEIRAQAVKNLAIEKSARRAWRELKPLILDDEFRSRLERVVPQPTSALLRFSGRIYSMVYNINSALVEREDILRKIDLGWMAVGLVLLVVVIFKEAVDWYDKITIGIALAYNLLFRFPIWYRKSHLGQPCQKIWKEIIRKQSLGGGAVGAARAGDWLSRELVQCGRARWAPVFAGEIKEPVYKYFDTVLAYSDWIYSARIAWYRTSSPQDSERLRSAIQTFPEGLWGAAYPDFSAFSIVLPIEKPTDVLVPARFTLDHALAAIIRSTGTISSLGREVAFLIVGGFCDVPAAEWPAGTGLQNETRLLFLTLMELAHFLENIADAGNFRKGMRQDCNLYWLAPSAALQKLLHFFGFRRVSDDLWFLLLDGKLLEELRADNVDLPFHWQPAGAHDVERDRAKSFVALLDKLVEGRNKGWPVPTS